MGNCSEEITRDYIWQFHKNNPAEYKNLQITQGKKSP
jgi:hypothetical protein